MVIYISPGHLPCFSDWFMAQFNQKYKDFTNGILKVILPATKEAIFLEHAPL